MGKSSLKKHFSDTLLIKLARCTRLTRTGTTAGTVAYMPPEQAEGEKVDHRRDIWALDAVIYEVVIAQLPFSGEHEQDGVILRLTSKCSQMRSRRLGRELKKSSWREHKSDIEMLWWRDRRSPHVPEARRKEKKPRWVLLGTLGASLLISASATHG